MTQAEINQREWENPANWSSLIYNSPRDTRIFVPKRRGFGVTMNFGHKNGKVSFLAILVLLLLPALIYTVMIFVKK